MLCAYVGTDGCCVGGLGLWDSSHCLLPSTAQRAASTRPAFIEEKLTSPAESFNRRVHLRECSRGGAPGRSERREARTRGVAVYLEVRACFPGRTSPAPAPAAGFFSALSGTADGLPTGGGSGSARPGLAFLAGDFASGWLRTPRASVWSSTDCPTLTLMCLGSGTWRSPPRRPDLLSVETLARLSPRRAFFDPQHRPPVAAAAMRRK